MVFLPYGINIFFYVVKPVKFCMTSDFLTYKGLSLIPDFTLEYSYALVCFIENIFFEIDFTGYGILG